MMIETILDNCLGIGQKKKKKKKGEKKGNE